jgi:peptidyl-prolyl cis-trans isomerase C
MRNFIGKTPRMILMIIFMVALALPAKAETTTKKKEDEAHKKTSESATHPKKASATTQKKEATTHKKASAANKKKASSSTAKQNADTEPKVAIVNGSVITQKAFDQELILMKAQIEQSGQKVEDNQMPEFRKHVLNQLITAELLYQESQQKGIIIPNDRSKQYFDDIKKRSPSEEAFNKELAAMKTTEEEMRLKISKALAIQELITKYLATDTTVTDDEAKALYDSRPELFKKPESIKASHILIKVAPNASQADKDEAMKKIKEIQERINKGEDFAELAKTYSQCPSAPNGGDLGYFTQGQMVKPFEDAAFSLAPGAVSNIVETQFGYHLIKAIDKKGPETVSFETAKENIKKNLSKNKSKQQLDAHIAKLMETAKI